MIFTLGFVANSSSYDSIEPTDDEEAPKENQFLQCDICQGRVWTQDLFYEAHDFCICVKGHRICPDCFEYQNGQRFLYILKVWHSLSREDKLLVADEQLWPYKGKYTLWESMPEEWSETSLRLNLPVGWCPECGPQFMELKKQGKIKRHERDITKVRASLIDED